jgi:hypothetical protein
MSDPYGSIPITKGNKMKMSKDFEHAWLDIYLTFEDNAFDQSKAFHANDGSLWIGKTQFVEVPF